MNLVPFSRLAESPQAVFGMLIAIESGKNPDELAMLLGTDRWRLEKLLDEGRNGALRRVPAAIGSAAEARP